MSLPWLVIYSVESVQDDGQGNEAALTGSEKGCSFASSDISFSVVRSSARSERPVKRVSVSLREMRSVTPGACSETVANAFGRPDEKPRGKIPTCG